VAEELRDVSLIYKLKKDTAEALLEHGIDTIEKLAAQDIDDLPKIPGASVDKLNKAKIQARSLVEKRPIFIGPPEQIQETDLKLYFDIEGDPWLEAEYLFGFWVVGDAKGKYARFGHVVWSQEDKGKYFLYFLAETPAQEAVMWNNLLDWLRYLPSEYKVYHYAHYEKTALKNLLKSIKTWMNFIDSKIISLI